MIVSPSIGERTVSTPAAKISALLAICLFAAVHAGCGGSEEPARAVAFEKPVSFTGDPGLILGTWLDDSENALLGMHFESETTYSAPDRFTTRGRVVSLATGAERELELDGTWAIKGGLLTTRLESSNHPLFTVGSNSSRRIDALNEKELVTTEAGYQLRLVRKPS